MKAEIIAFIVAFLISGVVVLGQELPEIGRIEVVTKDYESGVIDLIQVNQITEKKVSWTVREIDYYLDYHRKNILESERIIKHFSELREKILEAIKDVKLKKEGDKTL